MPAVTRNVEAEERRAWRDYADRLRGLEGADYESAEQDAWEELQSVLNELNELRDAEARRDDDTVG